MPPNFYPYVYKGIITPPPTLEEIFHPHCTQKSRNALTEESDEEILFSDDIDDRYLKADQVWRQERALSREKWVLEHMLLEKDCQLKFEAGILKDNRIMGYMYTLGYGLPGIALANLAPTEGGAYIFGIGITLVGVLGGVLYGRYSHEVKREMASLAEERKSLIEERKSLEERLLQANGES
ncbi:hypothetical protein HZC30_07065 [Candidatus Woesearchaeota archaeon]|nr:hypothetical protein [Candidatus Woesearchaeota archaeon]